MRELAATGWMHNRVRLVVGSFLAKDLLVPWQHGEAHFADRLVDFDPASNAFNWQWLAGSGADASPYFRIFNPACKARSSTPKAPTFAGGCPSSPLLARWIHTPWAAPPRSWQCRRPPWQAYPLPIVDHAEARRRALAAFEAVRAERVTGPS